MSVTDRPATPARRAPWRLAGPLAFAGAAFGGAILGFGLAMILVELPARTVVVPTLGQD